MIFKDRQDAGQRLAQKLIGYQGQAVIVYVLPRGGVILGAEVARTLRAPLDLIITRKVSHPYFPEYAVGVVTEDGHLLYNERESASIETVWFQEQVQKQQLEARRRRETYLKGRKPRSAQGKIAILVDDGIATGLTFRLAVQELQHQHPQKIVAAVPVIPQDIAQILQSEVDELVALEIPDVYAGAVGAYYESFDQVTDERVIALLDQAAKQDPTVPP